MNRYAHWNRNHYMILLAAGGSLLSGGLWLAKASHKPSDPPVAPLMVTGEPKITLTSTEALPIPKPEATPEITPQRNRRRPVTVYDKSYLEAIQLTSQMVRNSNALALAKRQGLDILNVTWEDTGRFKGSTVGPNISDMTIQVGLEDARTRQFTVTSMPVIRFPNFADKSCDLDPRDFTLLVGNERGKSLRRISLYDFLREPTAYLNQPRSWRGEKRTLLADRDSKVLVSAQACFLPVPKEGLAKFNPVLFNYQSESDDPAVLTVLATREGTSVTVIDNKRDAFPSGSLWGQRLFHNANGKRTSLTGQRMSDFEAIRPDKENSNGDAPVAKSALNMVLLIQIPLKQKPRPQRNYSLGAVPTGALSDGLVTKAKGGRSDVENAVIGHGTEEGPFTEINGLKIERDPDFPVRVTVQFYKATSNGIVSATDMEQIAEQINTVYAKSDYVGSLVTGGQTGRVTEYEGLKVEPADWWEEFWARHERNTGDTRAEALRKLEQLLGKDFQTRPVCDLYLRNLLRHKG